MRRPPMMPPVSGPMHNQIGNGRFSQFLSRFFTVQGTGASAPQLASEVMPVQDVTSQETSTFFLRGERLCSAVGLAPAVAAQNSTMTLSNPTGSGMMVILDRVTVSIASPARVRLNVTGISAYSNGAAVTRVFRDLRLYPALRLDGGAAPIAACALGDTSAAGPADGRRIATFCGDGAQSDQEIGAVILPGQFLYLIADTQNISFEASFHWRERSATAAELTSGS